jgi:arylsulfatase
VEGEHPLPAGQHQVRMEFAYDGGGIGKGGTVSLYVDSNMVGEGRVDQTEPFVFSADETLDIGVDDASATSPDYTPETSRFNGEVNWVEIDIDEAAEDLDHLITEEERYRVAMGRQ